MSNRSLLAPTPLRLLVVGWPKAATQRLEQVLAPLRKMRQLSLDVDEQGIFSGVPRKPGYYHILVISPAVLGALPDEQRQKLSRLANLLFLAPGGGNQTQELLGTALAGIAFPIELTEPSAIAFLHHLCAALVSQQPIIAATNQAWQMAQPGALPPWLALPDGSEAVWPHAPTAQRAPSPIQAPVVPTDTNPSLGPAVVIGQAIINPINAAFGDQVNITRGTERQEQYQDIAGGDQVNIISHQKKPPALPQSYSIDTNAWPFCIACGQRIEPDSKYCSHCGAQQVKG